MAALVERVSFAAGEIGIPLQARTDLARYQIAVEKMENYYVMVEGGANRRPGTGFVDFLNDQSQPGKFIPFRLSATDYYMLVINHQTIRFLKDGGVLQSSPGVPYTIACPWLPQDLANLRSVSRGNVIFVACEGGYNIQEITRIGLTNWIIGPFTPQGGPFKPQNLDQLSTVLSSGHQEGTSVALFSTPGAFFAEDIGQLFRLDESEFASIPEFAPNEVVPAGQHRRYNGNVYQTPSGGNCGATPPTHTGHYESIQHGTGFVWTFVHGPFGWVRITNVLNPNQATAVVIKELPLSTTTTATFRWWAPAWGHDGFPTNIAWSGQRMWYFRGDQFWASGILDPHDMEETGEDDGAISGRILSPDPTGALVDATFALAAGALVVGTSDVEWIFRSSSGVFETVTAKTVRPVPDTNEGSQKQIPALVDGGVMFANKTGRRLIFGKIDKDNNGSQRMDVEEVTVGARHITDPGVVAMAWQRDPNRILWVCLKDGSLVALTWMPKQQILAPHRHPMENGLVEEIAVLPSAPLGQDDVYMIVRRVRNGLPLRNIEILKPAFSAVTRAADASNSWHVDAGLALHSAVPVTQVFGLTHLLGMTVAVLADGAEQSRKVVSPLGSITLDRPARNVLVGLPIRSEILDLPRDVQSQEGATIGLERGVREINVQLLNCGGGAVGTVTVEGSEPLPAENLLDTGDKVMGAPIKLFHGLKRMTVECETGERVRVRIVNDDAMPCQVLGISPRVDIEETP